MSQTIPLFDAAPAADCGHITLADVATLISGISEDADNAWWFARQTAHKGAALELRAAHRLGGDPKWLRGSAFAGKLARKFQRLAKMPLADLERYIAICALSIKAPSLDEALTMARLDDGMRRRVFEKMEAA